MPINCLNHLFNEKNLLPNSYKESIEAISFGDNCRANFANDQFARFLAIDSIEQRNLVFSDPFKLSAIVAKEITTRLISTRKNSYKNLLSAQLKALGFKAPIFFYDHHLCHASSAFFSSPFEEATYLTLDGSGDLRSGIIGIANKDGFTNFSELKTTQSIGVFYKAITAALGFMPGSHEGKITGLAAFGNPKKYYGLLKSALYFDNQSGKVVSKLATTSEQLFSLNNIYIYYLAQKHIINYLKVHKLGWDEFRKKVQQDHYRSLIQNQLGKNMGIFFEWKSKSFSEDLAASAQLVLEECVTDLVRFYLNKSPSKNLVCAGGVFANVKLNQKILEQTNPKGFFIFPAMGDEGLSTGAAQFHLHKTKKLVRNKAQVNHMYHGINQSFKTKSNLTNSGNLTLENIKEFEVINFKNKNAPNEIAKQLANGKIIGVIQGRAEFGPRALGNRSIFADPTNPNINEELNRRLKRNDFMPFAPIVTEKFFFQSFDSSELNLSYLPSRFMTITLNVKPHWQDKIRAVVHIDGTARPQIVDPNINPFAFQILQEFGNIRGFECLINTSFNIHEEPIVNTIDDGIRALKSGAIDILATEHYLLL